VDNFARIGPARLFWKSSAATGMAASGADAATKAKPARFVVNNLWIAVSN